MSGRGNKSNGCPRLIEVALPIREISAECVREKNISHAHISRLHIWWARRPLAASRAVVFASIVPDPDNPLCPADFRAAVEHYLKAQVPAELKHYRRGRESHRDEDPYQPYQDMQDSLRNRLLMFIAKWSPESLAFEVGKRKNAAAPRELLDDRSLVKWETSNPENTQGLEVLHIARELVKVANEGEVPTVLDPFAGGGAIPLEAGRLGCGAIANDYNPVAHLILRATCEFPQKYGKPGKRKALIEESGKKVEREVQVSNILVHDLQNWANWVLEETREKIEHLYPAGKDGRPVLAYLWARTAPCSNPSCQGQIPLIRSLVLCSKGSKTALTMNVDKARKEVSFGIAKGKAIKRTEGTKSQRGPAVCLYCEQPTSEADLRAAGQADQMGERMMAVVVEGKGGKDYRLVENTDLHAVKKAEAVETETPREYIVPEINGPCASPDAGSHHGINLELYGFTRWGQLFSQRQLVLMDNLVKGLHRAVVTMERTIPNADYRHALATYLALWIDRVAAFGNTMCRWNAGRQNVQTPFSGQSVPMMWDYPEVNPFADSSGTASKQLEYMLRVVRHEETRAAAWTAPRVILGSATKITDVGSGSCDYVITDPPYGNSIAYADLSDFFYVWLKRSLGNTFPKIFTTPQTPKEEEATSHKHRHNGSRKSANEFYRCLLAESFTEVKRTAKDPKLVTVMFAHQSTEVWNALLSALFEVGLSPDATWPIATEMPNSALVLGMASLESSVTVACRPREVGSAASFKSVRREVEEVVGRSVKSFWSYGLRGADLIVACYGPAVGVFGKYGRVEKADGTPVGISELLELAKQAARDAIAGEFRGDKLSTLYYIWANLYGTAEQAWDDARLVVQIGGDEDNAMEVARGQGIFVVDGSKCRLTLLEDRANRRDLGIDQHPPHIDALHRSMLLWKEKKRKDLVEYLGKRDLLEDGPFWKLAQALFEVLPRDLEDWKLVNTLLGERQTLHTEGKRTAYRNAQRKQSSDEGGENQL